MIGFGSAGALMAWPRDGPVVDPVVDISTVVESWVSHEGGAQSVTWGPDQGGWGQCQDTVNKVGIDITSEIRSSYKNTGFLF